MVYVCETVALISGEIWVENQTYGTLKFLEMSSLFPVENYPQRKFFPMETWPDEHIFSSEN